LVFLHQAKAKFGGIAELASAHTVCILVTLVPVLYEQGGFGRALTKGQVRFNTFGLSGYAKFLDACFHLVHATHMTVYEARALGQSKATVVVSPSTEGNLGDGIFRRHDYGGDPTSLLALRVFEGQGWDLICHLGRV
jgi:hypothetical protein